MPRRLCLPPVISWYLLPVGASSSYDAVHLPRESHRSGGVSLMVRRFDAMTAVLRSVIGNLFINELGSLRDAVSARQKPRSLPSPPCSSLFSFERAVYCPARRSN